MAGNNNNGNYFYNSFEDKNENYSSDMYGGSENDHEVIEGPVPLPPPQLDSDKAEKTVKKSLIMLASVIITVFSSISILVTIWVEYIGYFSMDPISLCIIVLVFATAACLSVTVIKTVKHQTEYRTQDIVSLAIFTLISSLIMSLTYVDTPISKILFTILFAAAAAVTVFITINAVKNKYSTGALLAAVVFIVLGTFLNLRLFVNPVYLPIQDFNSESYLFTSNQDLPYESQMHVIIDPMMKERDEYEAFYHYNAIFPDAVITSEEELNNYFDDHLNKLRNTDDIRDETIAIAENMGKNLKKATGKYDENFFNNNSLIITDSFSNYETIGYSVDRLFFYHAKKQIYVSCTLDLLRDPKYTDKSFVNDNVNYVIIEMPKDKLDAYRNYTILEAYKSKVK